MALYDCLKCPGYCCSYPVIEVKDRDAERIAKHFGLSLKQGRKVSVLIAERLPATLELALAAYNLGPAKVAGLSTAAARRNVYVRKVLARYNRLLIERTRQLS